MSWRYSAGLTSSTTAQPAASGHGLGSGGSRPQRLWGQSLGGAGLGGGHGSGAGSTFGGRPASVSNMLRGVGEFTEFSDAEDDTAGRSTVSARLAAARAGVAKSGGSGGGGGEEVPEVALAPASAAVGTRRTEALLGSLGGSATTGLGSLGGSAPSASAPLSRLQHTIAFGAPPSGLPGSAGERWDVDVDGDLECSGPDAVFVAAVMALLADAEPALKMEEFVPAHHVAEILCGDGVSAGTPSREDEVDDRLQPYVDALEDADRTLGDYVVDHYSDFNRNIKEFAEIIVTLSSSQDTIAGVKQDLSASALALEPHTAELRQMHHRLAKTRALRRLATMAAECATQQARAVAFLEQRQYLSALDALVECRRLAAQPLLQGIPALAQVSSFALRSLEGLRHTVIHDVLNVIFVRGGRFRLSGAETAASSDPYADTAAAYGGSRVLASFSVHGNVARFVAACIETLRHLDAAADARARFASKCAKYVERTIVDHIHTFCRWHDAAESLAAGGSRADWSPVAGAAAGSPAALGKGSGRAAQDTKGGGVAVSGASELYSDNEVTAQQQRDLLQAFLRSLFATLEQLLRNIGFTALVAATAEFPFLRTLSRDAFDAWEQWELADHPIRSHAMAAKILRETQMITTLGNSGATESAMAALWTRLNALTPTVLRTDDVSADNSTTPTAASTWSLGQLLALLDRARRALTDVKSVDAATVERCAAAVASQLTTSVRQHVHQAVREALKRWDVGGAWADVQRHVEVLLGMLCGVDVGTDVSVTAHAAAAAAKGKSHGRKGASGGARARAQRTGSDAGDAAATTLPPPATGLHQQPPPAVAPEGKSLSALLSDARKDGILRFVAELGAATFSVDTMARRAQKAHVSAFDTAASFAGGDDGAAAVAATQVNAARSALIREAIAQLRTVLPATTFNAVTCFAEAASFARRVRAALPASMAALLEARGGGGAGDAACALMEGLVRGRLVPQLREHHRVTLDDRFGSGRGHVRFNADPLHGHSTSLVSHMARVASSSHPVVAGAVFVRDVLEQAHRYSAMCPELRDSFYIGVACFALERLLLSLKYELEENGRGSIAWMIVGPHFQKVFLHSSSAKWDVFFDESSLYGAMCLADAELFRYYDLANQQRAASTRGGQSAEDTAAAALGQALRGDTALGDPELGRRSADSLRLSRKAAAAIAAISHTSEWLAGQCIPPNARGVVAQQQQQQQQSSKGRHRQGKRTGEMSGCDGLRGLVPPMLAPGADAAASERLGPRFVALHHQLVMVARAALAVLAIDVRFIPFAYLPQLRDESYNGAASSQHAEPFVRAYTEDVAAAFRALGRCLPLPRQKYVALTIARPIPELLLMELAQLRDKRIGASGRLQLQVNVATMQTAVQLLLPGDADVANATGDYFAKAAAFVALLMSRNVVDELVTSGLHRKFTAVEMENLVALAHRGDGDGDAAFRRIMELRRRLQHLDGGQQHAQAVAASAASAAVRGPRGASPSRQPPQPPQSMPSTLVAPAPNIEKCSAVGQTLPQHEESGDDDDEDDDAGTDATQVLHDTASSQEMEEDEEEEDEEDED